VEERSKQMVEPATKSCGPVAELVREGALPRVEPFCGFVQRAIEASSALGLQARL